MSEETKKDFGVPASLFCCSAADDMKKRMSCSLFAENVFAKSECVHRHGLFCYVPRRNANNKG